MNKPLTGLVAVVFALGASAPVFAATHSEKASAETCQSMASELDQAFTTHSNSKKIDAAKKLQAEGDKLCSAGKYSDGVQKYKMAMSDLTGNPKHK